MDLYDLENLEGGVFGNDDNCGWQICPYNSARRWPCKLEDADSILVRGALEMPDANGQGHIDTREGRRMAYALLAMCDAIDQNRK